MDVFDEVPLCQMKLSMTWSFCSFMDVGELKYKQERIMIFMGGTYRDQPANTHDSTSTGVNEWRWKVENVKGWCLTDDSLACHVNLNLSTHNTMISCELRMFFRPKYSIICT